MPTLAMNLFDRFRRDQLSGNGPVNLTSVTVKLAIVDNTYTPNQNTHEHWSDANADEVSGTGYTAGGATLATPVVTLSGAGLVDIDFDDPAQWAENAGGFSNGRRFIAYVDTGTPATSTLIGYSAAAAADFGNTTGPVNAQLDAGGLIQSAR